MNAFIQLVFGGEEEPVIMNKLAILCFSNSASSCVWIDGFKNGEPDFGLMWKISVGMVCLLAWACCTCLGILGFSQKFEGNRVYVRAGLKITAQAIGVVVIFGRSANRSQSLQSAVKVPSVKVTDCLRFATEWFTCLLKKTWKANFCRWEKEMGDHFIPGEFSFITESSS